MYRRMNAKNKSVLCVLVSLFIVLLMNPNYSRANEMKHPYLQAVTTNSVYVLLESPSSDQVTVEYGTTTSYTNKAVTESIEETTSNPVTYVHNIKLQGLQPNTLYHYRVFQGVNDTPSGDYSFTTAVEPGTSFRFTWLSDPHFVPPTYKAPDKVIKKLIDAKSTFSLYTGDLADNETYENWKDIFFIPAQYELAAKVPFFNSVGNHERWSQNTKAFTQSPESASNTQEYYSFDYGDMHVLVISTQASLKQGSEQYKFAMEDLKSSEKQWKIVATHKTFYPNAGVETSTEVEAAFKAFAEEVIEPNDVDMVLSGHQHYYQHNMAKGVHYVTLSTASHEVWPSIDLHNAVKTAEAHTYGVCDVTPETLDMNIYDDKGNSIEKIHLSKNEPVPQQTEIESIMSKCLILGQYTTNMFNHGYESQPIIPDDYSTAPFVEDGRTLVPVRAVSKLLGAKAVWDGKKSTVTVTKGDKVIKIKVGSKQVLINNVKINMDTAAQKFEGKVYMPVRTLVGKGLGYKVYYAKGVTLIAEKSEKIDIVKDRDLIERIKAMLGM